MGSVNSFPNMEFSESRAATRHPIDFPTKAQDFMHAVQYEGGARWRTHHVVTKGERRFSCSWKNMLTNFFLRRADNWWQCIAIHMDCNCKGLASVDWPPSNNCIVHQQLEN